MPEPTRGALRVARACVVTLAAVVLSVASHVAGGGELPGAAPLAAACGLIAGVALAGSGRRWTFGRLLVLVGAGQLGCHLLLDAGHSPAGEAGSTAGTVAMPATHLAAAVLVAALLAQGDALLYRLVAVAAALARAARRRVAPSAPVPVTAPPGVRPATARRVTAAAAVFVVGSPRRGPPLWRSAESFSSSR